MAGVWNDGNAVLKDLTALFEDTRSQVREPKWGKFCTKIDSDGAYEKYAFPSAVPFPRQWTDERIPRSVDVAATLQLDNNLYELTLEFGGNLLQDARAYKGLSQMVSESAAAAFGYQDYLASQLLVNGGTSGYTAYDGNIFYSASSHLYAGQGSNTITNTLSGTGKTADLLRTDLQTAMASLRTFKDNAGKLLNPHLREGSRELLVVCPPAILYNFKQVLNTAWNPVAIGGTASTAVPAPSVMEGLADLESDGYLTDTDDWHLFYVGTNYRPFVMQEREPLRVDTLGFDSEYYKQTGRVRILTRQRMRAGYFAFYRAVRTTN